MRWTATFRSRSGDGRAVPDAGGGRVLDLGSRHGGDGAGGARDREGGRRNRDRGVEADAQDGVHGVEMFRKLLDQGQAGDNVGVLLRGTKREEVERGQVLAKPGVDHAAHQVHCRDVRAEQGRGRAAHAVFQGLSAAVLLSHDGRDGSDGVAGGHRDGDAGGQHLDDGDADCADRDGRGAALCHSRGRPNRRRRRRGKDHRVDVD